MLWWREKKKTSGRPSVCEVGFLRLKFSSWEVRFESFWSVQQRRANTMKDPMLEIVSAVLDRSLFLGVAFTFFPYFFYPNGWWVQPQACGDGDHSLHFLVLFGTTSWVMRLRKGLFREKHLVLFVGEVTKCYYLGHFVPCPILCAANLMQVHYMQHALFEQQKWLLPPVQYRSKVKLLHELLTH